jgi:hypothetical protein
MRITRFAAVLSLALAAAPTLMAATRFTPVTDVSSSTAMAPATALPADMGLLASLRSPVTFHRAAFTFTATVNGAYDVNVNAPGYWYVVVSGGTAPYTYFWELDGRGLNLDPSATSWSGSFPWPDTHYTMVTVRDANGVYVSSNQFFIHVH